MVLNHRTSSIYVVVLAILLFMIDGVEPKRQSSPGILRLVEIETVDDEGVVKARVVAEYKPTDSKTRNTREDDEDEDLRDASSGDSEGIYGDSYDMVANDEPMAESSNHSSSESSGLASHEYGSNVSSTSTPVTNPVDSKTSTVVPTTGQIYTSSSSPTTVHVTTNIDTTTAVAQTSEPITQADDVTFTTTGKASVTTLSTLSPSSKDMQTNLPSLPSKVTEVTTNLEITNAMARTTVTPKTNEIKRTTEFNVTSLVTASTTAKSNVNNQGIYKTPTKDSTITNTTPTKGVNINVQGQKDPKTESRRRKALFGFVTVEILIALLAGALFSILLVAFLVHRLKKRNEGSYELSETIALRPKEISDMSNKKEVFV